MSKNQSPFRQLAPGSPEHTAVINHVDGLIEKIGNVVSGEPAEAVIMATTTVAVDGIMQLYSSHKGRGKFAIEALRKSIDMAEALCEKADQPTIH